MHAKELFNSGLDDSIEAEAEADGIGVGKDKAVGARHDRADWYPIGLRQIARGLDYIGVIGARFDGELEPAIRQSGEVG